MTTVSRDIAVLRGLAEEYLALCSSDEQQARRDRWRAHNSLQPVDRPPLYVRAIPWRDTPELQVRACEDPFFHAYESWFRLMLCHGTMGDDYTFHPWVAVGAARACSPEGIWGLEVKHIPSPEPGGSWRYDPPIKALADRERMAVPRHAIDEEETARRVARLQEAIGDILPVIADRSPLWRTWNGDISTQLAHLRGLEQVMWDMEDHPEWLHGLLAFMRDGILASHAQAEAAGDWRLSNHENQAMPYAGELPDPSADATPVTRQSLWVFVAAQEFTLVSPAMHEEFLLRYQLPIMAPFGLVAYGCCEDLTRKIDMLRQIPNLRRIAVTPRADLARCAEQIGTDYVISYRPNPAEMVSCGFDPEHICRTIRHAMDVTRGQYMDITLKDVETVEGHPDRLREWTRIVREETERFS